jgi:AcrR family transcriptional regulator
MSALTPRKRAAGRREAQRLETERLIKGAALALFREHGYEATTTKQIADLAGVAHGTVFLVAPSKEGLLVGLLEDKLREITRARLASMPRGAVLEQLVHVFSGIFDFYAREPALTRVLLKGILFFGDEFGKAHYEAHVSEFSACIATLFAQGKKRGEIRRDVEPDAAASSVLALYVHLLIGFLNAPRPDRRALGAKFRACLALVFRGLAVAKGRR